MPTGSCRNDEAVETAHRVNWFAPDRPVDGVTVFVRPMVETTDDAEAIDGRDA